MPTANPPPSLTTPAQYQRFLDIAKDVEADPSPDAMDRVFDRLKPAIRQARPGPAGTPKP
jgi:hypothetical protein